MALAFGCAGGQGEGSNLEQLVGLYRAPDGTTAMIASPQAGQYVFAFGAGEVRALTGSAPEYTYGPSLGVATPATGSLRERDDSLVWTEATGPERTLGRVPLREREVTFVNGTVRLAGTVILPPASAPVPAVVMLQGSGPETRSDNRLMAYFLATQGIGTLTYDKRATGGSGGDSFDVPFKDLADDAIAGLRLLQRMPEVRPDRVGMFGPSQGSWIALEATTRARDIAFLILQSGDATNPLEQEMYRGDRVARLRGLSEREVAELVAFRRLKFLYAITGRAPEGWDRAIADARHASWLAITGDGLPKRDFWGANGYFDPLPALRSYRRPVLAVFGARDTNKDVGLNARLMREAFAGSGNPQARVIIFDDANHGLFETKTGMTLERELPSLQRLVPGYLGAIVEFLDRHAR